MIYFDITSDKNFVKLNHLTNEIIIPSGPTKPRAESEIRYIDEGSGDEGETDALLPANHSKAEKKQAASLPNHNNTAESKQEVSPTNQNIAENKQDISSTDQNNHGNQQETASANQNTAAGSQKDKSSTEQNRVGNQQDTSSANQNKPGNEQEKSPINQNHTGSQQNIEKAPQPDIVSSTEANNETQVDETTPMISKSSRDNDS